MTVSTTEYLLRSPDATWDYARWEHLPNDGNRYEVIDGVLYMSTAPSHVHQRCILRLIQHVGLPLEEQRITIASSAPIGVIMPGVDPVQPDFLLIRLERAALMSEDGRIRGVPDLIAEVLSPTNPELDLVVKRAAYARAGVPEYWILRPATRDVLVHTGPDASTGVGEYTSLHRFSDGEDLVSPTLPITIPVAALFAGPPTRD